MTAMLSPKHIADLYTKLEAPVAVADLLDRQMPLSEDESAALLIMLSEMTAVKALLSVACCAQIIASRIEGDAGLTASLKLQSDFVLDDYGPAWLQQLCNRRPADDTAHWSHQIQEDLEAMSDLMMVAADIFGTASVAAAEICMILQDQAMAHAQALDQSDVIYEPMDTPVMVYGDNVIPFPVRTQN